MGKAVGADTHAGVAAIAPSTDTPAGRQRLVAFLQHQVKQTQRRPNQQHN
jgi:hypothetical protein